MAPQEERQNENLRLALPKGSMEAGVSALLSDAGIQVRKSSRGYRPKISIPGFEAKILRPPNIVEMLHAGSRDLGFAGPDWVAELNARVVEVLDCQLDPVRVVAAAPKDLVASGELFNRPIVVASEYRRLTTEWIQQKGLEATFVQTYGATEVFPPEDADLIVDNTATGNTLQANGLTVVDELMTSSTRLYANPGVLQDPRRKEAVDRFVLLLFAVLEARRRVMVEVNVDAAHLEAVIAALPCMREPTVSRLSGDSGYAVKAAVPRGDLPAVIPEIKARGGGDIVVSNLAQIVP
jgi:ATP phosphoribosyltransferase